MKRKLQPGETVFTWILMLFSLFVLVMAWRISGFSSVSSPGAFPMAAAVVMVVSIASLIFGNRKMEQPDTERLVDELREALRDIFRPVFLIYTTIILLYMVLLQPIHFLPASFLFLVGSIIFLKGASPLKSLGISAGLLACIYAIFHFLFRVVLP
jgi:putative tricarboxylic transport membrane protein